MKEKERKEMEIKILIETKIDGDRHGEVEM